MSSSAQRSAIVDLGSNSVRLVVFEGVTRNPLPIFNEKVTLKLGRGLDTTGRLNEEGVALAMDVLGRFHTVARAMGAEPFQVLATAAVRDATNGPDFVDAIRARMPGVPIRVLEGTEEADYAARGVLCGLPEANGLVADIGGGSLELIHVADGQYFEAVTTKLGVIRLHDRAKGSIERAAEIANELLAAVNWLPGMTGRPLYLVGGAFRALARLQIARTQYPLNLVHLFSLSEGEAREMADWVISAPKRTLEKLPGAPRKRLADAPFAAVVLRCLMERVRPSKVVFSVDGLREGWYMRHVASSVADLDPMTDLATEMANRLARSASLAEPLVKWTAPLFREETRTQKRLRELACMLSDIGSYDHPEYRAEQTYRRVMHGHGVGFDHSARAFIGLTLAVRYEVSMDSPLIEPSRQLLSRSEIDRAVQLGLALRLAYTLCAGTKVLLDECRLLVEDGTLVLILGARSVRAAGSAVRRRFERLAAAMQLQCQVREE
ncbi:Ppx/GppA family phosphatase [Gluconobacter roseus]|uniref:Exopolyphosphatase n=1 Tax=Gluconobacter roseus NBRC 3990 TaxID=1307950 RepID=A0A4Y3M1B0_9PROT|nr:Ppx/GppA family phosphatase [Gluconobacter roseus]KXV43853.1 exopolyphosphatase [Gluconobacter roseus]GBR45692.1 exopolyphosphatase [Gluconobacter roseus NBRC 3990]GEB03062.1 exopolyphosphatase [Gluconobacter roseus NBRC 3990]GLP93520.1 exopolyphosphatase [Gluconobacter roseus NBRC 3990]